METTNKTTNNGRFTPETAKKANKASRESARHNRSLKEWAKFYGKQQIKMTMPDKSTETTTWDGAVVIGMFRAAMNGDTKAAQTLAKLTGQMDEQVNVNANVKANVKAERNLTPEESKQFLEELNARI